MTRLYLFLAVIGAIVPLAAIAPWVAAHGFDIRLLVADLLANRVSAFFGLDVIVSAAVLVLFVLVEARRSEVRFAWVAIVATLCIGVSCGLPLFLTLREAALSRGRRAG